MPNCWKFFAGLSAGFLAVLLLNLGVFNLVLGVPTESSRWTFEVNRKKQALARVSAPPRLLIVGGSASLFGLSAQELEKRTGVRTLNLSTHAALGTDYILDGAKAVARPGDTVLLVMEYELYVFHGTDSSRIDYLVSRDPAFMRRLSLLNQWKVFMLTPEERLVLGLKYRFNLRRYAERIPRTGAYDAGRINEWGDQTFHPRPAASPRIADLPSRLAFAMPEQTAGFEAIDSFCRWAQEHHVRVLATYPNLLDQPEFHTEVARRNAERIANFYKQLGVPVIGAYTDVLLPPEQFFDTVYHLTDEAALTRTDRLAEKLKPFLTSTNISVRPE